MGSRMLRIPSGDKIPNLNQSTSTSSTPGRSSCTSLAVSFRSLSQPTVNTCQSPFCLLIRYRRTPILVETHSGTPSITTLTTIFYTSGRLVWKVLESLLSSWYTHSPTSSLVRYSVYLHLKMLIYCNLHFCLFWIKSRVNNDNIMK